jgi:predicted ATPase
LHARIVRALEERFPERAEREPELLAHHCAEAGLVEEAVAYRCRAGRRAIARSELAEAVSQLEAGLDALAGLPEGPGRRRLEMDLQQALGGALVATRGYAAPDTGRAFARARELWQEDDDPHRLFPVLNGQVEFHTLGGKPRAAHAIAAEMLRRATRSGDAALLIPAHRAACLVARHLGRHAATRAHAERVLALYDPARHRTLAPLYSFDQRSEALGYLSLGLFMLGCPDQARSRAEEMLAWTRGLCHPNSLAHALYVVCILRFVARDMAAMQRTAEEEIALATERCLPFYLGFGRLFRALALCAQGEGGSALADLEQARAMLRASGTQVLAGLDGAVAETHARAGHLQKGLRIAGEACALAKEAPSFWANAEKFRCRGELLLLLPQPDRAEAEACFLRAIEIARGQRARWWELRAAVGLARLWRDQGRRTEAGELLAPIHGWFTEGSDLPDLQDAEALLRQLV